MAHNFQTNPFAQPNKTLPEIKRSPPPTMFAIAMAFWTIQTVAWFKKGSGIVVRITLPIRPTIVI